MQKSATLNLRVDPKLKADAENILGQLGVPMSTAVNMFLRQITLVGGIPFTVTLPQAPGCVNADMMSVTEIHEKLKSGLDAAKEGRTQDAKKAFEAFRESL